VLGGLGEEGMGVGGDVGMGQRGKHNDAESDKMVGGRAEMP